MLRNHHIEDSELEQLIEPESIEEDEEIKKFKRNSFNLFKLKDLVPDQLMDYIKLIYRNKDNRNYQITSIYHPTIEVDGQEVPRTEFVNNTIQKVAQTMLKHIGQLFLDLSPQLKSELELLADKGLSMESTDPRHLHALQGVQTRVLVTLNVLN